jgi:trans-2,3-dihydro-3-hydroxyanthranilate isomerase
MTRHFYTIDVFTGQILAGNPLAVVLDAQDLDDQRMQAIAREFNLSQTVFAAAPAQTREPREATHLYPGPRGTLSPAIRPSGPPFC